MRSAIIGAALAAIPALVSAFPSFPNPLTDGAACLSAISQVSCSANPPVDPNSYGTCCYNGALKPGFKESGLVLSTQFWNVSTGPADSTTIHGLWPDYCDGTYPAFCSADSGIPTKSGQEIEELLQEYDPALLAYMRIYYENEPSFWEHEYNKHGTCYTTLRGKCQLNLSPFINQTSEAVVGYFQQIVHEFTTLPTYKWLAEAGITPSTTKTYSLVDMENALKAKFGFVPYIGCYEGVFSEVWYYFHVRGPLINGQYIPTAQTGSSSCPATGISYPPKTNF